MQHIVLLEDDAVDAELIERILVSNGIRVSFDVADSRGRFEQMLAQGKVDLVISDSAVNGFTALEALKLTKTLQPQSGFIILSGGMDETRAEQARQLGAIEWVRKSELAQLPPLVQMSLDTADTQTRKVARERADNNNKSTGSGRTAQRLVRAVTDLSKARDLQAVRRIVLAAARDICGADGATFVLRDGNLCYYADEDAIEPLWKGQRFPMASCISGWTMIHRTHAVIADVATDARIPQDAYRSTFVKSLVMVPIRADAPIGAIGNYWATKHEPTPSEVRSLQALADSASIALENVQLYQQLERRVSERTQQLTDANKSLAEFSYFVSHDLRSPIRHIDAFASILESELGAPTPMARKSIDTIKSSAANMTSMLEGLLMLAQLGSAAIDSSEVDMNALANETSQTVREQSAVTVNIAIDDLPPCRGSETLLRQIWANLLTNAVKFSTRSAAPAVTISSDRKEGQVRYIVHDNGVGFDMAMASKLFTAFQRLHSKKDYPGTGIGLAIVNRIITRHGGRVWAESKAGQGATFYFTLGNDSGDSALPL